MKRTALLALVLSCLWGTSADARPGGGSSFKGSSSSSSRSSSSSSSSRSSSSSSSGSSSRSSSSSSSSSSKSGTSGPTYKPAPVYTYRVGSPRERATSWTLGAPSLYGTVPPRPAATRVRGNNEREGEIAVLGFLGVVGFIATAMLGLGGVLFLRWLRKPKGWTTAAPPAPEVSTSARSELEALKAQDPDFSIVCFEDFVYALYTEAHTARGAGKLDTLAPYLRPEARAALAALGTHPVSTVVVGSMRYDLVHVTPSEADVVIELEANYTEAPAGGSPTSYWVAESWTFTRKAGARSRPPDRVRVFVCPNCGAPLDRVIGGSCGYCQAVVDTGAFDWVVGEISVMGREARPPMLTGTTEETGSELPTRIDAGLGQALAALAARDPTFQKEALFARVGVIFQTMQVAWSSLAWDKARPYLSDNLWTAQTYWIEAYRRSGLRNVMENPRIGRLELARVTSDRWFDAITLRVFATGLDYTVRDSDGQVVGGDRKREREYTEYWTLIRASGAKGPARTDPVCPSCGAPLALDAAGHCGHCRVKLTSGQFDWVLSRIEQDEVYEG
ncbi:MAG: TIM44-like domain-containing protein [Myxococcales bacterium]|nr:TIM44-like domain-containing protein [Myxococcales bacterium]